MFWKTTEISTYRITSRWHRFVQSLHHDTCLLWWGPTQKSITFPLSFFFVFCFSFRYWVKASAHFSWCYRSFLHFLWTHPPFYHITSSQDPHHGGLNWYRPCGLLCLNVWPVRSGSFGMCDFVCVCVTLLEEVCLNVHPSRCRMLISYSTMFAYMPHTTIMD